MTFSSFAKTFSAFVLICTALESSCTGNYDITIENLQIENGVKKSSYGIVHGARLCAGKGYFISAKLEGCTTGQPCKIKVDGKTVHAELNARSLISVEEVGLRSFLNRAGTEPELVTDTKPLNMGVKANELYTITGIGRVGTKHKNEKITFRYELYNVADSSNIIACGIVDIEFV